MNKNTLLSFVLFLAPLYSVASEVIDSKNSDLKVWISSVNNVDEEGGSISKSLICRFGKELIATIIFSGNDLGTIYSSSAKGKSFSIARLEGEKASWRINVYEKKDSKVLYVVDSLLVESDLDQISVKFEVLKVLERLREEAD
jgi:hypothetical protein